MRSESVSESESENGEWWWGMGMGSWDGGTYPCAWIGNRSLVTTRLFNVVHGFFTTETEFVIPFIDCSIWPNHKSESLFTSPTQTCALSDTARQSIVPAKLLQHIFDGFMCSGYLVSKNLQKSREETFGWPKVNEFSDAGGQSDRTKLRQTTHT